MGKEHFNNPNDMDQVFREIYLRLDALEQGNDEGTNQTSYGGEWSTRRESGEVLFRSGKEQTTGTEETAIFGRTSVTPLLETGEEGAVYPFLTYPWTPSAPPTMSFNSPSLWTDLFEFRGAKFNDAVAVSLWARAIGDTGNTTAEFRVVDRLAADATVPAATGAGTPSVLLPANAANYLVLNFDRAFRINGDVGIPIHHVLQGRLVTGTGPVQVFMDKVVGAPI